MVKIRDDLPIDDDNAVNIKAWTHKILSKYLHNDPQSLLLAIDASLQYGQHVLTPFNISAFKHGLLITEILAVLNLDPTTLAAAMLLCTVRAGGLNMAEIATIVSPKVAELINGVMELEKATQKTNSYSAKGSDDKEQQDNLRKMLFAVVEDAPVVLIKLAEVVTCLRLADNLGIDAQNYKKKLAVNTIEIYAPLANRLGIGQIKWELEDLAFRYLEPEVYKKIAFALNEKRRSRESYIADLVIKTDSILAVHNIHAEVFGRPKHIYSIWRKMQRKGVPFEEIYDVRAIRILVNSIAECYIVLDLLHKEWPSLVKEVDDYIALPKGNNYRSLHTTVHTCENKIVEFQIRTYQMNKESELGLASHWAYKEQKSLGKVSYQQRILFIKAMLEEDLMSGENKPITSVESIASFKQEVFNNKVYVFTPNGKVVDLEAGSTPIDFAYSVHTEVGNRCRGAKINGKIVALTYCLKSGDQVEILAVKDGGPSRDWLNQSLGYIKTSRARSKVQNWFHKLAREENILQGKAILDKELKRNGSQVNLAKLAEEFHYRGVDDLLAAIGAQEIKLSRLFKEPNVEEETKIVAGVTAVTLDPKLGAINVGGVGNLKYMIAKCCLPVPFEAIIGYITQEKGISIHHKDCKKLGLLRNAKDKMIQVSWNKRPDLKHSAKLVLQAYDRKGLVKEISNTLSKKQIKILQTQTFVDTGNSDIITIHLTVETSDYAHLSFIINALHKIPGISSVTRITQ